MGWYIQTGADKGKADALVEMGAIEVEPVAPSILEPQGLALVCVIDNGPFESAGYCFSDREFADFSIRDGRPRRWVTMDLKKVHELTGYKAH